MCQCPSYNLQKVGVLWLLNQHGDKPHTLSHKHHVHPLQVQKYIWLDSDDLGTISSLYVLALQALSVAYKKEKEKKVWEIIWVAWHYKLTATWTPSINCHLAESFSKTCGVTNYGSGCKPMLGFGLAVGVPMMCILHAQMTWLIKKKKKKKCFNGNDWYIIFSNKKIWLNWETIQVVTCKKAVNDYSVANNTCYLVAFKEYIPCYYVKLFYT